MFWFILLVVQLVISLAFQWTRQQGSTVQSILEIVMIAADVAYFIALFTALVLATIAIGAGRVLRRLRYLTLVALMAALAVWTVATVGQSLLVPEMSWLFLSILLVAFVVTETIIWAGFQLLRMPIESNEVPAA